MSVKAVLFDLDGTLVNSLADLASCTDYALNKHGFPAHDTESYKYFVGDGIPKLIERALPQDKRTEDIKTLVYNTFIGRYRLHFSDKTVAYDGIPELLDRLSAAGLKTAVVSNKAQEMADAVVEKIFTHKFDLVFGKREGIPAKPDPTAVTEAAKLLGVPVSECVLVGDSGMDVAAAANAGCTGIGVLWGFRTERELIENGACGIAKAPSDIWDLIKKL